MDWWCENIDWCNESERAEVARNNPEQVAERLQNVARLARLTAEHTQDASRRLTIRRSAERLDAIGNHIGTLNGWHGNFEAVHGLYTCLDGVTPETMRSNPDAAARAFGQAFVFVGRLAANLPPPLNEYAAFLTQAGDFFVNMRNLMDWENPNTSQGRELRQAVNQPWQ